MKYLKKAVKLAINALTCILLAALVLIIYGKLTVTFSNKLYPNYFGYTAFEVASGSMKPTLDINDVIIIKIGNENIKKDDIIAFEYENSIITHRVVFIDGDSIVVKGDNNNTVDKPIKKEQIIGVMVKKYSHLGLWKKVIMEPKTLIALFITLILFDFALSYNKQEVKNDKKKKKLNKSDTEIIITEVNPLKENMILKEPEKLLELTRKIDIEEINKLIEDPGVKLNKSELNNIKNEIKKIEDENTEDLIALSKKERNFIDYTIRLDLNEIRKQIDSKIK